MLTRRRFLTALIPACALAFTGLAYVGYRRGGCPLSDSGACEGPCAALIDANGDLFCDRLSGDRLSGDRLSGDRLALPAVQAEALAPTSESPTQAATALPTAAPSAQPTPPPTPAAPSKQAAPPAAPARRNVACPFGLVNDRYPGRCRRYVDRNGNGFCDLSEPTS